MGEPTANDVQAVERRPGLARPDYRDIPCAARLQFGGDWIDAFLKG